MRKLIAFFTIFFNFIFANLNTNENFSILDDLGMQREFLKNEAFLKKYKELSSKKRILYYDSSMSNNLMNVKIVQEELSKKDFPSSFFYIPLVETTYKNVKAKSGPVGLWQIMPVTAKGLKLRKDEFIDERLDLVKSTKAAVMYLENYYKKFNKWFLAVLAYNAGEGRVIYGIARASMDNFLEKNPKMIDDKLIKVYKFYLDDYKNNKGNILNLHTIYRDLGEKRGYFDYLYLLKHNKRDYLPKTSVNYINTLVSFSILGNKNEFKSLNKELKYSIYNIKLEKGISTKEVADFLNLDYNSLKNLNLHLLKDKLPISQNSYNFYIPSTKKESFEAQKEGIRKFHLSKLEKENKEKFERYQKKHLNTKANKISHKVQSGESLYTISRKYGLKIEKIKKDNNKKTNTLKIGEIIEIYK